jgi:hypothetical protein
MLKNSSTIYKHICGYGVHCEGLVSSQLDIIYEDSFSTIEKAYAFAIQASKDTGCDILWDTAKPEWALNDNEDAQ